MKFDFNSLPQESVARFILAHSVSIIEKYIGRKLDMSKGSKEVPIDLQLTANGVDIDLVWFFDIIEGELEHKYQSGFFDGLQDGRDGAVDSIRKLIYSEDE